MEAANRTFISSTFWTERVGAAAALAALDAMAEEDAPARVHATGLAVGERWRSIAADAGLGIAVSGLPAISAFSLPGRDAATIRTYVIHRLLERGYLAANAVYASIAHTTEVLDPYLEVLTDVMGTIAQRSDEELIAALPSGASRTGFGRLT